VEKAAGHHGQNARGVRRLCHEVDGERNEHRETDDDRRIGI
jgi:hypothetical protein